MDLPNRKHIVRIQIQADDWVDILEALEGIGYTLATGKPGNINSTSGSPRVGWHVQDELHPEMTHERYFQELGRIMNEE